MADLIDLPSWKLGTADLIQQIATLGWLHCGEEGKEIFQLVTGFRVALETYNRLTEDKETDALRNECILRIADYIKKHPRASEAELATMVQREIESFKQRLEGKKA